MLGRLYSKIVASKARWVRGLPKWREKVEKMVPCRICDY